MRRWPDSASSQVSHRRRFASGAAIVNARGVPGTLGFFARTRHDGRLVLVSSHHVLFGGGGREGDRVWFADGTPRASMVAVAWLWYGRAGIVHVGDADVWVDAAAARLDDDFLAEAGFDVVDDAAGDDDAVFAGQTVSKQGGATGSTIGRVVDVGYLDRSPTPRARPDAPAQLLVRSSADRRPFSAAGDSGAALRDSGGAVLGLLWGVTPRGDGVACPIAAVLHVLHLRVARLIPRAATLAANLRES